MTIKMVRCSTFPYSYPQKCPLSPARVSVLQVLLFVCLFVCWEEIYTKAQKNIFFVASGCRTEQLSTLRSDRVYDVLVIGGGATGCGVALDSVLRGKINNVYSFYFMFRLPSNLIHRKE